MRPIADDMGRNWRAGEVAPATFIRRDGSVTLYCEDHGQCLPQRRNGIIVARPIDCHAGQSISPG